MIKREWVNILAVVLFFALALYFQLHHVSDANGNVITSYDSNGNAVSTSGAFWSIWLLPIATLALYLLTVVIAEMSVYKIHLDRFFDKFFSFKLTMIFLIFALYVSRMIANLSQGTQEIAQNYILIFCVAIGFFYLSYMMHHLKSNHFAPWIKGRNKMWEETHVVGTWLFFICGVVILLSLIPALQQLFLFLISVPLFSIVIMIVLYSYIIFKKEHHIK